MNPAFFARKPAVSDPYWANVVLLLLGNGADASETITDSSPYNRTYTHINAAPNRLVNKTVAGGAPSGIVIEGAGALYANGTSTGTYPETAEINTLGNSWTVEYYARRTAGANNSWQGLMFKGDYNDGSTTWIDNGMQFGSRYYPGNPVGTGAFHRFYFYGVALATEKYVDVTGATSLPLNTTQHHALVKDGTDGRVYIDGVLQGTVTSVPTAVTNTSVGMRVGSMYKVSGNQHEYFTGYLEGVRITKAVRYNSNFTPPTSFPTA